jgi:geranylgeranyl reductase family protein
MVSSSDSLNEATEASPAGPAPVVLVDVVVVGAGPAGSSAARALARAGLSTLIVEKSPMPRRKVCGGGVTARALGYLDFELPPELIDRECYGVRLSFGGRTIEVESPQRVAVMSTRARFDTYLLAKAQEAGARLLNAVVREVRRQGDEVVVATTAGELRCRAVIVAGGAGNKLSEVVRPPDGDDEYAVTLEAEIPVEEPDRFADLARFVDIDFGASPFGYGWVFHHRDHYSVGVIGRRDRLRNPHPPMERYLDLHRFPRQPRGMRGHPIPCGGVRRRVVRGRVLLAGDAAGFVDPFTGEGIAFAIRSGQLAAEAIVAGARAGWDVAVLQGYQQRIWDELGRDLRRARWIARAVYRFPRLLAGIFVRSRRLSERYLEVIRHRVSYGEYLRWLAPRLPLEWLRGLGR